MESLAAQRKLTDNHAAAIVGSSRLMNADVASMQYAIYDAFGIIHAGENLPSVVDFDGT